jgi:hypothetical protein
MNGGRMWLIRVANATNAVVLNVWLPRLDRSEASATVSVMCGRIRLLTKVLLAGAGILLVTITAIAEQLDQASRDMIRSQLRTQVSVPGSLSIMHVEVTKPNDNGLQTACGWFVSRDIHGRVEAPKAFAMSFSTAAQVAQIHVIGGGAAEVQTIRTFCKEVGIDF